jgi:hypothetical protein
MTSLVDLVLDLDRLLMSCSYRGMDSRDDWSSKGNEIVGVSIIQLIKTF